MSAKIILPLVILCLGIAYLSAVENKYITNPERSDGFGAQFQTIIYAAIYAELNHLDFVYTPFKSMEHNYENETSFLAKKEELINLEKYFEPAANYAKVQRLSANEYIDYFEHNLELSMRSKVLQEIKLRFRNNKPSNYFKNDKINIAIHIRRPNAHDTRLAGADIPDRIFLEIINYLKAQYKNKEYLIHIYSQGGSDNFKSFADQHVKLHLNESIEDTFTALALADVLVMSPSSFSYTAGLISNGEVYYLPFWHVPLLGWHIIDITGEHINVDKRSTKNQISVRQNELEQWLMNHTSWHHVGTNSGWAGFDKVYFIAMPDRIEHVTQVAERLGVTQNAWVLNAINKNSLNIDELASLNIIDKEYLSKLHIKQYGAIGCQLSHLAVILDCYRDQNAKTCVIFEDDIYKPAKEITAQVIDFRKLVEKYKIRWDILFLDYCMEDGKGATLGDIRWLSGNFCTHAYVINKEIAPLLLASSTPIKEPIDGIYYSLIKNKDVVAIGPDKARYFAQNRYKYNSNIDPGYIDNPQLIFRYR